MLKCCCKCIVRQFRHVIINTVLPSKLSDQPVQVHGIAAMCVSKVFILAYHLQCWFVLSFTSHLMSTMKAKTSLKHRAVLPWTKLKFLEIRVLKRYWKPENHSQYFFFCVQRFCQKFSFHWRPKSTAWRNRRTYLQHVVHAQILYLPVVLVLHIEIVSI